MKFALAVLAFGLLAWQSRAAAPAFTIDREYHYDFHARLVSGVPGDTMHFAGTGMKGKVVFQNRGNYLLMKFIGEEFGTFNGKVHHEHTEEFKMPYTPFPDRYKEILKILGIPVRFTMERGMVKTFDTDPTDPEWSVNIKRAMITPFQLNFERVNRVRFSRNNYLKPEDDYDFYRVMEDGVGGECETVYEMHYQPFYKFPYERVLNVSKHRNYDKCIKRPVYVRSTHMGQKCEGCDSFKPLQMMSHTDYSIRGDRRYFTIEKIFNVGEYLFTPFSADGEKIMAAVNQTFFFVKAVPIKDVITFPTTYVRHNSLVYNFTDFDPRNKEVDLMKPNTMHYHYYAYDSNYKTHIDEIIRDLARRYELTERLEDKEIPKHINTLVHTMSSLDYTQLWELFDMYSKYLVDTTNKLIGEIFMEALPLVGTNPSTKLTIEIVEKKLIPDHYIYRHFDTMSMYIREPNVKLAEEFFHMLETLEKTTPHKSQVYSVMWLAFGTLLHKGCEVTSGVLQHETTYVYKPYITTEVCKRYITEVIHKFEEAKEVADQALFIKVLGNIGMEDSFTYLRPILSGDKPYPVYVRKQAAVALFPMTTELREEILTVVVPVFFNYTEKPLMRILAFELIMACKPTFEYLEYIGESIVHDPSVQVASFVYSSYVAFANSTDPCYEKLSKDLKELLLILNPIYHGYGYSRQVLFSYYNDKYHFGGNTLFNYINSNDSFIPENIYYKRSFNIMGYKFDDFEMNVDTRGFHNLYETMIGPDGIFSPTNYKKSTFDLFRRAPRQVNPVEKELNEIDAAIKFQPREYEPMEAALSFKILNQEFRYFHLDEEFFRTFAMNNYFYLNKDLPESLKTKGLEMHYRKLFLAGEYTYIVPTEIGFPLVLSASMPSYFALDGNVKFSVEPGFFPEDRGNKKPTNIRMSTDLKPVYTGQIFAHMSFLTPSRAYVGYSIRNDFGLKFPIKTSFDYDLTLKKFSFKYFPSPTPYKIFYLRSQPATMMTRWFAPEAEKSIVPIQYMPYNYTVYEQKYGHDYFGTGLRFKLSHQQKWLHYGSYFDFFSKFTEKMGRTFDHEGYYHYWTHRLYNGLEHMQYYFVLNPTLRPMKYSIYYEPATEFPTTEYDFEWDFDLYSLGKLFFGDATYYPKYTDSLVAPTDRKYYNIHMELLAKGRFERKFIGNLNFTVAKEDSRYRKVSFDFERTPLPGYDTNPFKLCYRSTTKYPPYTEWYSFDHTVQTAEMKYDILFGKDCTESSIKINMLAERTEEQLKYVNNPTLSPKYLKCQEHISQGYNYSEECWESFLNYYMMKKYTIDIDYVKLPDLFVNYTLMFAHRMRHIFYDHTYYNGLNVNNPEGHIKLVANFSNYKPLVDIRVYKPHENLFMDDVYYQYVFPTFEFVNTRMSYYELYLNKFFNYAHEPMCFAQGNHFQTFDGVHYKYPLSKCYHIFFRDCSKDEKYTVMIKAVDHQTYTKSVKVFVGKHKVEVLPIGENPTTAPLMVRVDGAKQVVSIESKFVFPDPENEFVPLFTIMRLGDWYMIKSRKYGFEVMYNGVIVLGTTSVFHRGHVCGLCGEYNGEYHHDFTGPDGCVYYNETGFGYSYAIPDETCTVPKYDHECFRPYAPRQPGKCYFYRNKVIYDVVTDRSGLRSNKVCFSRLPIPECVTGCKATDYVKNRVGFHCLNTRDASTEHFIRDSKMRELTEIQNKSEDYYEDVEYPEYCVKM